MQIAIEHCFLIKMRPYVRYLFELCACFILIECLHIYRMQWINIDGNSKPLSNQATHLDHRTEESALSLHMDKKEAYDASKNDLF